MEHFSDRLLNAIGRKGSPACVGIDPVHERLPAELRRRVDGPRSALAAISEYCSIVLDAVADAVPSVKFQSACFERYRDEGVETLYSLIADAADLGLMVILDAKRGDIGLSAEHYAAGVFEPWIDRDELAPRLAVPDAVTINGYLGADGIEPFCAGGRGAFVLVRTSNPGGDAIQQARLEGGQTVAEHVARVIDGLSREHMGDLGYSDLGAVVGATKRSEIASLRALMPRCIFLVPGYGAQGGSAEDVRACFNPDGRGAIITASRSVIFAYERDTEGPWADAIAEAAQRFAQEVGEVAAL